MLNMPFSQNQLYIVIGWYFVLDIFNFARVNSDAYT